MKHQTPDSMKLKKLQRRLGIPQYATVGLLELLWIVTQKNAPRGNIGRFDNEEIAIAIDWQGDPDELVAAMLDTGWLEQSDEFRLVVHDWHHHAPRYVHGIAAKQGGFVTSGTIEPDYSPGLQSATNGADCTREQPNLTKPNLTKTYVRKGRSPEEFENLKPRMEALKQAIDANPTKPLPDKDRELCIKAVLLEADGLVDLQPLMASCKSAKPKTGTRWGYFRGALKRACEEAGHDFHQLYQAIEIPP